MPLYKCLTTQEEMLSHLSAHGIPFPNFTFHFEIITRERRVSDSKGRISNGWQGSNLYVGVSPRMVQSIEEALPFRANNELA
ncbi:hypothetical protein J1N35_022340 [Gossypium stocksii]|uniref:Uncharacterized protein n=1 Tax=Gossypium stocksii TaxID=47602 RepID=A0A9D3VIA9_9ROSI|nr:hypothetical protein J1N35_022340 [Gossypium stocksii]